MLKIIIADDEEDIRAGISRMVRGAVIDAQIDEVPDGKSLVEKVMQGGYDLVFTDYLMGPLKMDGVKAIGSIRQFNPDLPIYLVSSSQRAMTEAMKAGATGYVHKGMGPRMVEEAIKNILSKL